MQDYESLKSCSIKDGTLLLLKDIQHIYSDPISLKSTTFFSNLTEILYTIFGDEKNPGFKWLEKACRDFIEADPNVNFRRYQAADSDLRALIDLLSPYKDKNSYNLFTLMSEHLTESKYLLNESKLPQFTQLLISSRSYDHHILQEYKKLFQHHQDPKNGSYKFDLILSPFEFYLFVFIYSMKKFHSKSIEPKTPEDYGNNDLLTGLCCNPYLILLRKYLEYFISELSWNSSQKTYFRKLTFLMEDYFIHDLIHSSPQTFSKSLPPSQQTKFYQMKTVKRQEFTSKKIPCPHIHYAIFLMLHYLQKIMSPFTEDSQACHFLLGMSIEEARSKYARLTYNYILNCLKYWTKDLNNSSNLADLGYVWLKYTRPWDILQPNLVDDLAGLSQSKSMNEHTNQLAILKDLKAKYINISSEERDFFYLSHKEFYNTLNNYILKNLLFYTVLLKEFIIAFSEINNFSPKEINFFQEVTGLFFHYTEKYNMEPYYEFLNGHITFEHLRNLSLGPKKRIAPREIIERHIEEIGADYADLYFINDEAIKMRIVKLKDKFNKYLSTLISSIKTQRDRYEPVIIRLSKNMEKIISVLYSTFEIGANYTQASSSTSHTRMRQEGLRSQALYNPKARLTDPWLKPVGASDFVILYWIFYFIAKMYDKYFKLMPIEEKEDELYRPSINLRGFSRKMNVYRFLGVAFVVILLFRLTVR